MPTRAAALLAIALALLIANGAKASGATIVLPIERATAIAIGRPYSHEAEKITEKRVVDEVMGEVNELRRKPWTSTNWAKHGACAVQVTFLYRDAKLVTFFVYDDMLFEIPSKRPHPFVMIFPTDLPRLRAEIQHLGLELCAVRRPTHHSSGPARKAAQAAQFERWAS